MRLIVTEKNNSAKKIAEILSGGTAKEDSSYKTPFYTWEGPDGPQMTIGLKGHVLNPAFPEGYSNWQKTDLHELIDAKLIKEPTDKNVLRALRKVAKDATSVVIATDFDREGELIGKEALEAVNFRMNSDGFVFDQEIIAQVIAAGFRIAEIGVPTRYFPEASSASFLASAAYGCRILAALFWFTLNQRGLRRSRRFDSLRARYTRLP